ncbi:MAG: Sec-independent protein translocase subunit TatB [Stackebrandtia sp.]
MLDNLGGLEIVVLLLVALFIIGPERLPKVLKGVGNGIRKVRRMATDATADISKEVGHDIDITDLHPKTFIRKHVLSEADEAALKNPLKSALDDVKEHTKPLRDELDETTKAVRSAPKRARDNGKPSDDSDSEDEPKPAARSYDADAT